MLVIKWKLAAVMADRGMKSKDLAIRMGVDFRTVSNLKIRRSYPKISGDRLNLLCKALNCQVQDLIEYVPD